MKKIIAILSLTLFGAIGIFAQNDSTSNDLPTIATVNSRSATKSPAVRKSPQTTSSDDYKKSEFFVGYTFSNAKINQYDRDFPLITNSSLGNIFRRREKFEKGFTAAGTVNFSRYVGGKADFSISFNGRKGRVNGQNVEVKERLATYTLGFQLKDNNKSTGNRFRPFANVLAGVGNSKSSLKNCAAFGATCPNSLNKNRYGFVGIFGVGLDVKLTETVSFRVIQVDRMIGKITQGWRFSSGIVF